MNELEVAIARGVEAGVRFRPPASTAALAELERELGLVLPDDLRAFYALHDGAEGIGIAAYDDLLSVAEATAAWSLLRDVWSEIGAEPGMWSNAWLPITSDGGGSYNCVDLAAAGSRPVIRYEHADPVRTRVADSFATWLATVDWTIS